VRRLASCLPIGLALALVAGPAEPGSGRRGFGIAPVPVWVSPLEVDLAAVPPAEQVSDGIYYLLGDEQIRVGAGTVETFVHYAKKIVNEAGLEASSQLTIEYDPSFQTLALHSVRVRRDGAALDRLRASRVQILQREPELELQLYDGRLSAVLFLEDLRVGDVLEYAYTIRGANPVFAGRFLDSFDVEWGVPVRRMRWRLLWPQKRRLHVRNHRTSLAPAVTESADHEEYVWEVRDAKPATSDDKVPSWFDARGWVQLGEFESWAEVAGWGEALFVVPSSLSPDLERRVALWRRAPGTPADRVLSVLRFVQDEVRYLGIEMGTASHRPTAPAVVFRRRFGDCKDKALLLCTILRALGVEARPALVHTSLGRALDDWHPSAVAFNHVVVRVELEGRSYWVDPTLSGQGGRLDTASFPDYERALVLAPGTTALFSVPVAAKSRPSRTVRETYVVKDYRSPVEYRVETEFRDFDAESMRQDAQRRSPEEIARSYLKYYARYYPAIQALGPVELKDDRDANVVVTRERYALPDFWAVAEGSAEKEVELYPLTFQGYVAKPPSAPRSMPLVLAHPVFVRHISEVALPDEWDIKPESADLAFPEMRFSYRARYARRIVTLEYDYQSLADAVAPSRVASYAQALDQVRNLMSYRLQYRPSSPQRPQGGVNWGVVLTAALFAPLAVLGAVLAYRIRPATMGGPVEFGRAGIGGWLLWPALGVFVSVPRIAWSFYQTFPAYLPATWAARTTPGARLYHHLWGPVLLLELLGNITLLVGAVLLCVLLVRKRRTFPAAFIAFALFRVTVTFADSALSSLLPGLAEASVREGTREALVSLVPLFLWTPYLLVSKRVHATFVR
jgi:transglutaminase-like putative cysteine protease